MDTENKRSVPSALFYWITFIAHSLPVRSAGTFIELLIGSMLTQSGFVTEAYLAINATRHWTAYYKWLEYGKWSWLAVGRRLGLLVQHWFPDNDIYLVIDDKIIFRSSPKAPDCRIHHQHGQKPNRPEYVLGQCWVTLAAVVSYGRRRFPFPILPQLVRSNSNSTKLTIACALLRAVRGMFHSTVIVLTDAWYMKGKFVLYALKEKRHVIGQVRKDTALFRLPPPPSHKRGRPRKYGRKYTESDINALPSSSVTLFLYGKDREVRYRTVIAKARFLKGHIVCAVWVEFKKPDETFGKTRLLLSTDPNRKPEQIIQDYENRWSIEPMFNQTANQWGWKETWQQCRQTLHRWVQIIFVAYAIPQFFAASKDCDLAPLVESMPWRGKGPITAGMIRHGLKKVFQNFRVRDWWHPKYRIFEPWPGCHEA